MSRIGIMQPYFFPYPGYFSLIKHTDQFILFDTVQFIRHGWIERNRVLKQGGGWLYIQAPLQKAGRETLIKDCLLNNSSDWKGKILAQLQPYKKKARYYHSTIALLKEIFSFPCEDIATFNQHSLEMICAHLGFAKQLPLFSQMNWEIEEAKAPDEWALNICKKLEQPVHYINPIGGLEFFNRAKYENEGIQLSFQKFTISPYEQGGADTFEAGLSIIDALMFNSVDEVNSMLDQYELV